MSDSLDLFAFHQRLLHEIASASRVPQSFFHPAADIPLPAGRMVMAVGDEVVLQPVAVAQPVTADDGNGRCKTCRHWRRNPKPERVWEETDRFGRCRSQRIAYASLEPASVRVDGYEGQNGFSYTDVRLTDDEASDMLVYYPPIDAAELERNIIRTGENFGCVHWEAMEDRQ